MDTVILYMCMISSYNVICHTIFIMISYVRMILCKCFFCQWKYTSAVLTEDEEHMCSLWQTTSLEQHLVTSYSV